MLHSLNCSKRFGPIGIHESLKNIQGYLLNLYGAQNEAYMSRSAEKWVRGLCFNELGVGG